MQLENKKMLDMNSTNFQSPTPSRVLNSMLSSTMPVLRQKSKLQSISSPYSRGCCSPSFGSPSRLQAVFKHLTWREVKGHLRSVIGKGGFGEVYKANIQGFSLAVKKLRYTMMNKNTVTKSLKSEKLALTLKHRNIVSTYYVNDSSDPAFIVMEYVGSQTLQHLIDSDNITPSRVQQFSCDIASALHYIHQLNVVHLDVKPSNILITAYYLAKLGDFGCSQMVQWEEAEDGFSPTNRIDLTGTVAYRAPELLRGFAPTLKADIYAFGILLWQMVSRKYPYLGKDSHMVIFAVVAQGLRPSVSSIENSNKKLVALCEDCWSADPSLRPDAQSLLHSLTVMNRNDNT